jgi:hypothetical protein
MVTAIPFRVATVHSLNTHPANSWILRVSTPSLSHHLDRPTAPECLLSGRE